MSIYRFSIASPVRDVSFRYANDRPPVALIGAAPSADADQLSVIRRSFEAEGWQAVPVHVDGRNVLQVNGFKDEGQLVAMLMARSFAKGNPVVHAEAGDNPKRDYRDWLDDYSLKVGGVLNLIGDGALLFSGIKSGREHETIAGGLYTAGGLIAARYGNVKTEYHLRQVAEREAEYLKEQAGSLPEDCGLYSILRDKREGVINKTEDFLYRFPSQTMLGVYTLGALSMLQSGLKHGKGWDTAYGVSSVTTKLASLMMPEKDFSNITPEEQKKLDAQGPVGQAITTVQKRPLAIFGYGSMVTDALLGLSAYREYRNDPRQRSYIFKFITTGTYLAADLMFAMSKKNSSGKFDAEEQRQLEALAAESIAAKPKAMQIPLANQVAGFLSTQPEFNGSAAEIARSITRQVEQASQNPWACKVNRQMADPQPHVP